MFPNLTQSSKQNQNQAQNQPPGNFNHQQSGHNYNWGVLAAHSALAAAGYNAPTLMQGHSNQNAPTNSVGSHHQAGVSSQSTTPSNTPYHQFTSRNLPFAGYDYNYRSGGYQ